MAAMRPEDLYNPWLDSVSKSSPVPPPVSDHEKWNGRVDEFDHWWTSTQLVLHDHDLTRLAASTRATYGIFDPAIPDVDDPGHAVHAISETYGVAINIPGGWLPATRDRAHALNHERAQYIKRDQSRWCNAVIARLDADTARLILDPTRPTLRTDPDALFAAIRARAVGGTASEVGPRISREAFALPWPTKGTDGATITLAQQVDVMLSKYRAVSARLTALNAPEFLIPEPVLVASICVKAPAAFDTSAIASFEACTTLSALHNEMLKAARRIDERSPTGLQAFVTTDPPTAVPPGIQEELAALRAAISQLSSKPPGTTSRRRLPAARRLDKAAGAPFNGAVYCSYHGWGTHTDDRCYALHPELAPIKRPAPSQ